MQWEKGFNKINQCLHFSDKLSPWHLLDQCGQGARTGNSSFPACHTAVRETLTGQSRKRAQTDLLVLLLSSPVTCNHLGKGSSLLTLRTMLAEHWCKAAPFGNSDEAASLLETQTETCPKVISFRTQTHWQHRLQCWRTTGLAHDECCKPALKSQLFLSLTKPLVRTPGWPSQAEHCSGGCRKQLGKAENLLEVVTAAELSHSQTRWTWDPNTGIPSPSSAELWSWGAAESSLRWDEEGRPQLRTVCTPQVTAGDWGSPATSSSPSPTGSTALRAHSKAAWTRYTECFQGQMLSLSYKRMKTGL